jgi:hypothetical protein
MRRNQSLALALVLCACLVRAEDKYRPASPEPTPEETQILEYMNRLRADPVADMGRMAPKDGERPMRGRPGVDWEMFRKEMRELKAAPPLVFNLQLLDAARKHSHYMILNGLGHNEEPGKPGYEGKSFTERCRKAGYVGFSGGENCYRDARDAWGSHVAFTVDFGAGPGGMQPGRGHRKNMMNAGFREIGCSAVPHDGRFSVTHDFGGRRVARLAGGVVFLDRNGNGFYDLDEGLGGVAITADDGSRVTTWASGAYTLELKSANKVTLRAAYQGLSFARAYEAGKENIKFDWVVPPKEAVDQADKLLGNLSAIKDLNSPAGFNALVALHWGTRGLALDPERRARVEQLTGKVRAELEAHQRAVLDALGDADGSSLSRAVAEHRKLYAGTVAAGWFQEAQMVAGARAAVANFEKGAGMLKTQPSLRRRFVEQLEEGLKEMHEPAFRAEMEKLMARAKTVGN